MTILGFIIIVILAKLYMHSVWLIMSIFIRVSKFLVFSFIQGDRGFGDRRKAECFCGWVIGTGPEFHM